MSAFHTRHARAVAFMLMSVLCFAANDTITKQLTASVSVLPVLSLRAAFATGFVCMFCFFLKIDISMQLFKYPILYAKTILFILTIACFALSFKYNSFVEFYAVFLLFVQVFSILIDYYVYGIRPKLIIAIPMAVLILGAILALTGSFSVEEVLFEKKGFKSYFLASLLPVSTAFFYALYITFSNYINRKLVIDSISQNIPMLSIGCVILLMLGFTNNSGVAEMIAIVTDFNNLSRIVITSILSVTGIIALTQATRYDNASKIAPYEFIVIIYAIFIDRLVFNRPVNYLGYVGALLILGGAAAISKINGSAELQQDQ